jgi:hypothetical protein
MKTSVFLMGVATLIALTVAVVWFVHRVWHDGRRWKRASVETRDDDPILWI